MHEQCIQTLRFFSNHPASQGIDLTCEFLLSLRLVDSSVRCGIYDKIRRNSTDGLAQPVQVRQITAERAI
ncbi:hypothetical protein D3C72_1602360 [compost metagenome]